MTAEKTRTVRRSSIGVELEGKWIKGSLGPLEPVLAALTLVGIGRRAGRAGAVAVQPLGEAFWLAT